MMTYHLPYQCDVCFGARSEALVHQVLVSKADHCVMRINFVAVFLYIDALTTAYHSTAAAPTNQYRMACRHMQLLAHNILSNEQRAQTQRKFDRGIYLNWCF